MVGIQPSVVAPARMAKYWIQVNGAYPNGRILTQRRKQSHQIWQRLAPPKGMKINIAQV